MDNATTTAVLAALFCSNLARVGQSAWNRDVSILQRLLVLFCRHINLYSAKAMSLDSLFSNLIQHSLFGNLSRVADATIVFTWVANPTYTGMACIVPPI
jgi:hypothetical protein